MRRRWWLLWVASALLLWGCQSPLPRGSVEPIFIGMVTSMTGVAQDLGRVQAETVIGVQEMINAAGGIHGRPLQIVTKDTGSDPQVARTQLAELARDRRIVGIIGPSTSGECLAIVDDANVLKVPTLCLGSSDGLVHPVRPWVFKMAHSDALAVTRLFEYLLRHGEKELSVLVEDSGFGQSAQEAMVRLAANYNLTLVRQTGFPHRPMSDEEAEAIIRRAAHPETRVLIIWGTLPGPTILNKAARKVRPDLLLVHGPGVGSQTFLREAGQTAEEIIFPGSPILMSDVMSDHRPQRREIERYRTFLQGRAGGTLPLINSGGYSWDSMHMLAAALKAVGPHRGKVRAWLENLQGHVGVTGLYNFSPDEHNGLTQDVFLIVGVRNGQWVLLEDQP